MTGATVGAPNQTAAEKLSGDFGLTARQVIALVDSDEPLRTAFAGCLEEHGYEVHGVSDAAGLRLVLSKHPVDLVVLEANLAGENALDVCTWLSEANGPLVMMLSGRMDVADRILGLEFGADTYVEKPLEPRELLARIRALLRRRSTPQKQSPDAKQQSSGLRLIAESRQVVTPEGDAVQLTLTELGLMTALLQPPVKAIRRAELLAAVKGEGADALQRTVDTQIKRLRRKLETLGRGELIKTYWGYGYLIEAGVFENQNSV